MVRAPVQDKKEKVEIIEIEDEMNDVIALNSASSTFLNLGRISSRTTMG